MVFVRAMNTFFIIIVFIVMMHYIFTPACAGILTCIFELFEHTVTIHPVGHFLRNDAGSIGTTTELQHR